MTTAEHIGSIASSKSPELTIAGVPWPRYKVVALLIGLVVAALVGIATMTAGTAVLAGAAVGTVIWLAQSSLQHIRR
ncbi:MAG: hypothetical protein QOH57_4856 [Mycobacterium sp.]|jgi:hypothetical protein|nr:hypothetical protein [Mycobacterium sp.]